MFRFKRGIKVCYERQMYIYAVSRLYRELPESDRRAVRKLCERCGGEYAPALFEFVTTDTTATALSMKYYVSRATLYRLVKRYYEEFPGKL